MNNFNFTTTVSKEVKKVVIPASGLKESFKARLKVGGFNETSICVFSLVGSDYMFVHLQDSYYTVRLFTNEDYYQIKRERYEDFYKKEVKNLLGHFLRNK